MLDPDIRRLLDTLFNLPAPPGPPDVERLRAAAEAAPKVLGGPAEDLASIRDTTAPGRAGPVPVRIYRPTSPAPPPLMLYAHGGGWVTGSLDSHDKLCRILANRLGSVIVAVDYRLAPEHVYPAALDDVEAAWRWASANAHALGADGARFTVAGDSSGANLVAALTLRLKRERGSQPDVQLLLYPAVDATCSRTSYREFSSGYNLTADQMAWYWETYRAGADALQPELSPLSANDLADLPPAVIAVATADVLRDEALDYAQRLDAAHVPVRLVDCTGMIHGFLRWTGEVAAARRWIDVIATAVSELMTRH
ncbi:MAG: alpha/beta hydrolase [Betaproteobacteria bacterium]|nr:MAG: alpha/beta hydrolase [Betaproteobacteria bacterium]